ncbi:sigma-54-dependent Fis family transcriptional regulator [Thermoactinomyces mirandus]|uniref:Sigma-54-dependent Fis family transcriptional regulator n=1 Tax=Thermoactinomyces mirandus TaxID=2756294 RepID=A0A7W1XT12_9BACL|nr:sigma-54-dependent Fis family transcriptional regulator [Thermoactinomyces mirandus]MBA4602656.1 sigma-54-dependent Fis family transcriptional regulator [Thermoactinomyces mirandus]
MKKSNISVFSIRDLGAKSRELKKIWENFLLGESSKDKLRQVVYQSWERCRHYGVNPHKQETTIVYDARQLKKILNQSKLFNAALPVLHNLKRQTENTGYIVTLCDRFGRIIYLDGDPQTLRQAEKMNFVQGADWSEKKAGTNAIGTCIKISEPIQIFAAEHYCEGVHPWTCSSAPIYDPLTGELLGVIDLTGKWMDVQPHTLGMVVVSALSVQQRLKESSMIVRQILLHEYLKAIHRWPNDAVIVMDQAMNVVEGNKRACKLLEIGSFQELENNREWIESLNHLLSSNGNQKEQEWQLPSLNLRVYASVITHEGERAGFLLHLQRNLLNNSIIHKSEQPAWQGIIGKSRAIRQLIHKCQIVANTFVPVLITGESGTGKERFARAIHESSEQKDAPFIAVNCGAIPKELIASELFGYEPGTFTGGKKEGKKGKFEEADGGTLFLDEVGEMPLEFQVHLLRVLQEREVVRLGSAKPVPVRVRVIAATNQNLEEMMKAGLFRRDLYYRLNVVSLHIPPLNERLEDIPLLADYFVKQFKEQHKKEIEGIAEETLSLLKSCFWPGNVRELQNVLEYGVLFCDEKEIQIHHLPPALQKNSPVAKKEQIPDWNLIENEERKVLLGLLDETGGNLSEVARRMKIARTTLYRRLKKYQIQTN